MSKLKRQKQSGEFFYNISKKKLKKNSGNIMDSSEYKASTLEKIITLIIIILSLYIIIRYALIPMIRFLVCHFGGNLGGLKYSVVLLK